MEEPLFDVMTAVIVCVGVASVVVLRSASHEATTAEHVPRLRLLGHLLLGIASSLLLYRWVDAMTALPLEIRPNAWRSGALIAACGIGLIAAVKAVTDLSTNGRFQYFVIAAACGAVSLFIAAVWNWAMLLSVLLLAGIVSAQWRSKHIRTAPQLANEEDSSHEPALATVVSAMLLLLLLGTWQHVIENETQRRTRSTRYSAWPRTTALRNAWERTGWIVKSRDDESAQKLAKIASHEQSVALGLGTLLLVVIASTWYRSNPEAAVSEPTNSEASDAS